MSTCLDYRTMPREEIQRTYDRLAPAYGRMTFMDRRLFGVDRQRRRLLNDVAGHVLDVACGTGASFPFLRAASHVTGIDLSPGMLSIARRRADRLGLPVNLRVMDAGRLDFIDGCFDVVVSALSTCTFSDPVAALREMSRVVRPNGRILLLEHGRSSWGPIGHHQDRTARGHFEAAGCRWNQEPLDLARTAGLIVTAHRRFFFGVFHAIEARPQPVRRSI